jgi:hypothetical protein
MPWEAEVGLAYQLGPRPLNPGWEDPPQQEAYFRAQLVEERAARARAHAATIAAAAPEDRPALEKEFAVEERAAEEADDRVSVAASEHLHRIRKARYANWPRERIQILASVLFTGQSSNAVSVEGFMEQRIETVGRSLDVTPRFGVEGEPLPNRIVVRAGTYVEPSRYEAVAPRQHFTFGGDVRLIPLDFWGLFPEAEWKVSVALDIAPRYTNAGFGIGLWH